MTDWFANCAARNKLGEAARAADRAAESLFERSRASGSGEAPSVMALLRALTFAAALVYLCYRLALDQPKLEKVHA